MCASLTKYETLMFQPGLFQPGHAHKHQASVASTVNGVKAPTIIRQSVTHPVIIHNVDQKRIHELR